MNMRFEYLYRDSSNFKNWGEIIFSNKENMDEEAINQKVRESLISNEFFVAEKAGIPNLYFSNRFDNLDHGWHEFFTFRSTNEKSNDKYGRDITKFIEALKFASQL